MMVSRFQICATVVVSLLMCSSGVAQVVSLAAGGADQVWTGPQPNTFAGARLDKGILSAGDSRRDLVIGAPGGPTTAGAVYIIFGGTTGASQNSLSSSDVIISGSGPGDGFGTATAVGDVTSVEGTNPANLVVGAPGASSGKGEVFLFNGGYTNGVRMTTASARLRIIGAAGDRLGSALATADLNADGFREIVIGAPGNNRVYIIAGGSGLSGVIDLGTTAPSMTISGGTAAIGNVIAAGDIDGDNIYDLLLGAPDNDGVFVIKGGFTLTGTRVMPAGASVWIGEPGDRLGTSIRIADVDAVTSCPDPRVTCLPAAKKLYNDVLLGAPGNGTGKVYLLWGNGVIISNRSMTSADVMFWGPFGYRIGGVIGSGDINRDDPDDVAVVATALDGSGLSEILFYYGRSRNTYGVLQPDGRRLVNLATGDASFTYTGESVGGPVEALDVFEVTGEGARDVIAGIPSAGADAGAVYFTLSPKLRLSQSSISVTLPEGHSSTSATIQVTNPSSVPITWQTNLTAPWLSTSVNSGAASSGSPSAFTVTVNAEGLAPGAYSAAANVQSTSVHLNMTIPITVALTVTASRYLSMDAPVAASTLTQPFSVSGYAIDVGASSGTGVSEVDVYAYPNPGSGAPGFLVGTATYGSARPSVGSTYGSRFLNSGFDFAANRLPPGNYRIEAQARSSDTGAFWTKSAGSVNVTVRGVASKTDLDGDGYSDVVFQHESTGCMVVWHMQGAALKDQQWITPNCVGDPAWRIAGMADFDGDGKLDLLFQNVSTGGLVVWVMDGIAYKRQVWLTPSGVSDPNWRVVAIGDFDGDGRADLILQNKSTGGMVAWLLNGLVLKTQQWLTPGFVADPNWRIVGAGDIDGDGKPDLFFQNIASGYMVAWIMNGLTITRQEWISPNAVDPSWRILSVADMNGDGRPDLLMENVNDGRMVVWPLRGTNLIGQSWLGPGVVSDPRWRIAAPK